LGKTPPEIDQKKVVRSTTFETIDFPGAVGINPYRNYLIILNTCKGLRLRRKTVANRL
jgi:hypothetical protein